ncbi:MAG: mechanosensitive ion channel family protein [Bdellovibrionales bacterium]
MLEKVNTEMLMTYATEYGFKVLFAILIFVIGKRVAKICVSVAKKMMVRAKVDETLSIFIGNILYGLAMAFVAIAALSKLGVDTTSLAAILAAAGLAIGLALQGSLSNFASGVLIILFRPFKIGDVVNVSGVIGKVEAISIFTTELSTADNQLVIIPNGNITSDNITNITAKPTRRIDLVIGVGYDDDLKKVKKVLTKIVEGNELVLKDPEPTIAVLELADSSVNFVVRPWVKTEDYWPVRFDLMETIKTTLDKEGITIPYPQRDLHIIDGNVANVKKAA